MNEVQLIRRELAAQRRRARLLAAACSPEIGSVNSYVPDSYSLYFLLVLDLESKRLQSHLARLETRSDLSADERRALERCAREFASLAGGHAAAARDTAADTRDTAAGTSVTRNAEALTRLSTIVEELESIAESRYTVDDWRRTAHVDADSILEERRLHERARNEQARGEIHGAPSD